MNNLQKVQTLTDVQILKSYELAYVAADESGECLYSPVVDGLLITPNIFNEMYIDSPKTITFNIPLCCIFGYLHFYPKQGSESDIALYEYYNHIVDDYVWGTFDRIAHNPYYDYEYSYNMPITSMVYLKTSDKRKKGNTDLYQFKVKFKEPGMFVYRADLNVYNIINEYNSILLNSDMHINNNILFLLLKNNIKNKYKSCFLVWNSSEPALLSLGNYDIDKIDTINIELLPNTPVDIYNYITNYGDLFYIYNLLQPVSEGVLKIVDIIPPDNIEFITHGDSVLITSDQDNIFCWHKNNCISTLFKLNSNKTITLLVSNTPEFSSENYIWTYTTTGDFTLSEDDFSLFMKLAESDYIYFKFTAYEDVIVNINEMNSSTCFNNSVLITPNLSFEVTTSTEKTVYRILYNDWVNNNFTITHTRRGTLKVYIADTCSFTLSATNKHVLQYASIKSGETLEINADTISSWLSSVNIEGCLYVRFDVSGTETITFVTL